MSRYGPELLNYIHNCGKVVADEAEGNDTSDAAMLAAAEAAAAAAAGKETEAPKEKKGRKRMLIIIMLKHLDAEGHKLLLELNEKIAQRYGHLGKAL